MTIGTLGGDARPGPSRRQMTVAALVLGLACATGTFGNSGGGTPQPPPARADTTPFAATIALGSLDAGRPANRMLLGNNVQWVDDGDGLFEPGTDRAKPNLLDLAVALHPTVLRYPGGSLSDTYHWRNGMGPVAKRGTDEHFHTKKRQPVTFGTVEFLTLCRTLGAEPLITVNVATDSAEDAADWVRAVNGGSLKGADGKPLGPVHYWEIGNEPYLREDSRKELAVEPEVYARRANAFIVAMKRADPSIVVGIPLRSDKIGTTPATPFQGYNDKVLATLTAPYDFVSLHDAYMPILWDRSKKPSPGDVYLATMAATQVVDEDLALTRGLLRKYRPAKPTPIAITEYNALFSLGGDHDDDIASLGGALYLGDLLRLLAKQDDISMADFWSLNGNWFFGAFTTDGQKRPAYYVLQMYERAIRGRLVDATVTAPTFSAPPAGVMPALSGLPLITSLASTIGDTLRVIVINKDASRPVRLTLQGPGRAITALRRSDLGGTEPFDPKSPLAPPAPRDVAASAFPLALVLPPRSLTLLEFRLAR